jgi:signal transduction histidine kinase
VADEGVVEELRMLELGTHWVTVFQRLATDNARSRAVSSLFYDEAHGQCDPQGRGLFRQAQLALSPQVVRKSDKEIELPSDLVGLLADESALVPLRTNKGLRALILLDRRLSGEPIILPDLEQLDWFATQGALALQNAELINDLESAYQELKAVDQLKSNFLSTISHELRTPLTAITGFVDLVLKERVGPISENQRSLLERVARNTGHLNNMVTDLIEIAEIEAEGMRDLRMEAVDPLHVLFATFPRLDSRRRDQRVSVEPVFDGTVPAIVCDEHALERIFFHLLDNAMKFSPPDGEVQVEFKRSGQQLRIAIRDHGVGIPPDKLQRIFDQFFQVDNSLTRGHEGLGLGLAVTRMLVQATHGEIEVESTLGKGSTFTVSYPLA